MSRGIEAKMILNLKLIDELEQIELELQSDIFAHKSQLILKKNSNCKSCKSHHILEIRKLKNQLELLKRIQDLI